MRLPAVLAMVLASGAAADPARDMVAMANEFRVAHGLAALAISPALEAAAAGHGRDMVRRGFFSHTGSDGSTPSQRARRQNYRYCTLAENIGKGWKSAEAMVEGWMGSPAHRDNLLKRNAREIGAYRGEGNVWVLVVGTRMGGC